MMTGSELRRKKGRKKATAKQFSSTLSSSQTDAIKYVTLTHIIHTRFPRKSVHQSTRPSQPQILP